MDRKEVRELVREMKRAGVGEFTWKSGEFKLHVRFAGEGRALVAAAPAPAASAPAAGAIAPPSAKVEAKPVADGRAIRSPIVGTFYRSPSPDAPVYVNVGDRVRKGQVVCIVEAMKLMNQVESDLDGIVAEILVENAQPVQFGQDLFRLTAG